MTLSLHDIKPIGLCITTQELFDTRKFLLNYCEGIIIRGDEPRLQDQVVTLRREMNSFRGQPKFLDGYKAIIASNIDKIIGMVEARYAKTYSKDVEIVRKSGTNMIKRILEASSFEAIAMMEDEFKSKIVLPTHRLFIDDLRKSKISIV